MKVFVTLYCNDTTASKIVHTVRNVFFCIHIIVFCALEPLSCSWNMSSADHSIVLSDVIEIACEVRYAGSWWTPVIQCLPEGAPTNVGKQTVYINSWIGKIEYRNSVNVTSLMDGWQFNCQVSFETTSDNASSSSSSIHAPDSIHLWTTPVIYVKGYYFIANVL